jgi:hypothetical protein
MNLLGTNYYSYIVEVITETIIWLFVYEVVISTLHNRNERPIDK